jgi:predicted AAA+ superfamily ATPase
MPTNGRVAIHETDGGYVDVDWNQVYAAVWRSRRALLRPVTAIDPVRLEELVGIDQQKTELLRNTERFLAGLPANNALLWGARGTGKSSLVKAMLNEFRGRGLRLIEVFKDELRDLPDIVDHIRDSGYHFIFYCDDFSFEGEDASYVGLKSVLEGSIERPPDNLLFYVTSNRRHLLPEYMQDNQATVVADGELHYSDAVEERISLSDRFGLWLSFYPSDMQGYLAIVDSYFPDFRGDREALHEAAKMFAMARASRSGRTAKQFYNAFSRSDPDKT